MFAIVIEVAFTMITFIANPKQITIKLRNLLNYNKASQLLVLYNTYNCSRKLAIEKSCQMEGLLHSSHQNLETTIWPITSLELSLLGFVITL